MKLAASILIAAMAVSLAGCVLGGKPKTASAAPAPPKPAANPAPAPPPEPLSTPQTTVQLPPPQPLTPEAIATTLPPGETPPPPVAPVKPPSRTPTQRPSTPTPAGPVAPSQPPAAEPIRQPIADALPAAEVQRLQQETEASKREVRRLIGLIPRSRQRQQQATLGRIDTFLKQAEDAERRRDMRQASELAGRALVLARELK